MKKIVIIFCLIFLFVFSLTDANTINTTISQDSLEIGNKIKLTVTLTTPKDAIIVGDNEESLTDPIVVKHLLIDRTTGNDIDTVKYNYIITTYDYDTMSINPITYIIRKDTLIIDTLKSKRIPLKLISSIIAQEGDTIKMKDSYSPIKAGKPSLLWLWILLGVIATSILGYFLWKKFKKESEEKVIPLKPAFEEAMELIDILDEKEFIEKGELRRFVFELSEILKHYTGRRYGVNFPELTTEEIINWLSKSPFEKKLTVKLEHFFNNTHFIKFAGNTPGITAARELRTEAVEFIKSTKPIDEINEISKNASPEEKS